MSMNFKSLVSRFAEDTKWFLGIGETDQVEFLLDFEKLKVSNFKDCSIRELQSLF